MRPRNTDRLLASEIRSCSCSFSFLRSWSSSRPSSVSDEETSSARISSPARTTSPGRFRIFSTRASTGLESTTSKAGTTKPEASTTPRSARGRPAPVRISSRGTEGRSQPGKKTTIAAASSSNAPAQPARRSHRPIL